MREIEGLRTEICKPPIPAPSAVRPRILNFNNSGSQYDRRETAIPTTAVTLQVQANNFQDPSGMFTNNANHNAGNPATNNTFFTNLADLDEGISPQMAKELQQLRQMISSVPGVVQPIPEVSPTTQRISRFAAPIADMEIPKWF